MKRIALFAIAAAIAVIPLAGCAAQSASSSAPAAPPASSSASASQSSQAAASERVTLSVAGESGDKSVSQDLAVDLNEGDSVLLALQNSGLDVVVQGSAYGDYVVSIEGVEAGGSSGWTYSVNGEQVMVPAADYVLNDGDVVEWTFIIM